MEIKKENNIHVRYFAILREQRGLPDERIETPAHTALDLYQTLAEQHLFTLTADRIRVAINDSFEDIKTVLKDGDKVVFVPPVAGG